MNEGGINGIKLKKEWNANVVRRRSDQNLKKKIKKWRKRLNIFRKKLEVNEENYKKYDSRTSNEQLDVRQENFERSKKRKRIKEMKAKRRRKKENDLHLYSGSLSWINELNPIGEKNLRKTPLEAFK